MQLRMPRSYYFMGYILCFLLTTGLRFSYRMLRYYAGQREQGDYLDRIMVIGAGNAGQALIRELINNRRMNVKICCVIDDNPNKLGRVLEGIPIVGNRYKILEIVKRYKINRIIYAIPANLYIHSPIINQFSNQCLPCISRPNNHNTVKVVALFTLSCIIPKHPIRKTQSCGQEKTENISHEIIRSRHAKLHEQNT